MAIYRRTRNSFFGFTDTATTLAATTLSSPAFAGLPTGYSAGDVLPLQLVDSSGAFEVVWVTAHATTAATTVTVLRGQEGTTARAWPANSYFMCGPTIRDGAALASRAGLPADRFVGERRVLDDEGVTVQSTYAAGWQADVGVAMPREYGRRLDGLQIPTTAVVLMRGGKVTSNTDASGQLQVVYEAPFPTGTLHPTVTWVSGGVAPFFSLGYFDGTATAAGFRAHLYRADTGAPAPVGTSVTFTYLATGY